MTAARHKDLSRRIREMDEHPERGRPWEEVRERLWKAHARMDLPLVLSLKAEDDLKDGSD